VKLIANPPGADQVDAVLDHHRGGLTTGLIAGLVGLNTRVVRVVIDEPERFDEYVDEIAVERCLSGEHGLWERMTYAERNAVLGRALERRRRELRANREWTPIVKGAGKFGMLNKQGTGPSMFPFEECEPAWLVSLARATGFRDCRDLLDRARLDEKRREQASAA